MRGLQKSKRVSWASDLNLCQVKLFLSEESPSQVGLSGQDHLQAKASWPSQSTGAGSDDNLPPGFEGMQPANLLKNKLAHIPVVEWKCPPKFEINPTWQVAAGEESKEIELESQREMRVLEAVYPRPSAIPPNPAFPVDEPYYNDQHTPLIPITPIEDEDMAADTSATAVANSQTPAAIGSHSANGMPPAGMVPGVEPDIVSAAYSALNAAMSNSSQGNLIDPNLLIKILSNPTLIEKLVSAHGASLPSQQVSQAVSMPMSAGISLTEPPPPSVHAQTAHLPFSMASSSSGIYYPPPPPPPSRVAPVPIPVSNLRPPPPPPPPEVSPVVAPPMGAPPVKKDINYYKSLIQQHGGEKPEPVNNPNNPKPRDMKPKIMKPCIYFNSSRGCRHGANCVFQHDSSSQQRVSSLPEAQSAKRMKMDREITGT